MQIIHDSNSVFHVKLNPFTKQIIIINYKTDYKEEFFYEEIDEWNAFTDNNNQVYDYHLLYDSGLSFEIYPVINNIMDDTNLIPISLDVIL